MNFIKLMTIKFRVKKKFQRKLGYPLDLKNPQTYCEKIQWLKFNHNGTDQKLITHADKYAVRTFLEDKGLEKYLIPLLGVWEHPEEIEWEKLPQRVVLKLNNGSGSAHYWFVKHKSNVQKAALKTDIQAIMKTPYGEEKGEFHYAKMPPKIIAEAYLEEEGQAIKDYKFYCFHGAISFFSVEQGKVEGSPIRDYYTTDWKRSSVRFFEDLPRPQHLFKKPDNFDQMISLAESLSQGYPHIRVDLYNIDGKVYFGELTYAPENGLTRWDPPALDLYYGKLMDIHNITH